MRHRRGSAISLLAMTLYWVAAFWIASASSAASTVPSGRSLAAALKISQVIGAGGSGLRAMPASIGREVSRFNTGPSRADRPPPIATQWSPSTTSTGAGGTITGSTMGLFLVGAKSPDALCPSYGLWSVDGRRRALRAAPLRQTWARVSRVYFTCLLAHR